jgi:hypothetical protein
MPITRNTIFEILEAGNELEVLTDHKGRFKKELPRCFWHQGSRLTPKCLSNSTSASRFSSVSTPAANQMLPHKKLLSCSFISRKLYIAIQYRSKD